MRFPLSTENNHEHDHNYVLKCTDLPQFDALLAQAQLFRTDDKLHLRHLCNDTARCASLVAIHTATTRLGGNNKIILDYCRQRVTGETMEQLFDLADATGLVGRRQALQTGAVINTTEGKPVLHHVLRMPAYYCSSVMDTSAEENKKIPILLEHVHETRRQIQDICFQIRSGAMTGVTGKPLTTTLVVGEPTKGAQAVATALASDPIAAAAAEGRHLRFISHADPVLVSTCLQDQDPATTLVVLLLVNGTDDLLNARTVLQWLFTGLDDTNDTRQHHVWSVSLTSSIQACQVLKVPEPNRIAIQDDLYHPRYAVCSAAGLFPLCLQYSYPVMSEFLQGYHAMDEHFFRAPLRDNLPVILGLLTIWNTTLLGYDSRAVLPYAYCLRDDFTTWLQHLDMGSNGKRVALDGTVLRHEAASVQWEASDATLPLLHQGRVVPTDFIGCMESQQPMVVAGEALSNHDELMADFFAQPDALAYGKPLEDLVQEGVPEHLREHMVFHGNRPSTSILLTQLNAFGMGQLMALYEHRTAVAGFLWGLNSFTEFGMDLGSAYAHQVRSQLSASRLTGASVQGFNASTSTLLEHYLAYGKQQKKKSSRNNNVS